MDEDVITERLAKLKAICVKHKINSIFLGEE
jgi:hypothetical protein